jgi:hypothetical protein
VNINPLLTQHKDIGVFIFKDFSTVLIHMLITAG